MQGTDSNNATGILIYVVVVVIMLAILVWNRLRKIKKEEDKHNPVLHREHVHACKNRYIAVEFQHNGEPVRGLITAIFTNVVHVRDTKGKMHYKVPIGSLSFPKVK